MAKLAVAFDSCVFIDAVTGDGRYTNVVGPLIREAEAGNLIIFVSEITFTESCKLTIANTQTNAIEDVEKYLANEYFRRWPAVQGSNQTARFPF